MEFAQSVTDMNSYNSNDQNTKICSSSFQSPTLFFHVILYFPIRGRGNGPGGRVDLFLSLCTTRRIRRPSRIWMTMLQQRLNTAGCQPADPLYPASLIGTFYLSCENLQVVICLNSFNDPVKCACAMCVWGSPSTGAHLGPQEGYISASLFKQARCKIVICVLYYSVIE